VTGSVIETMDILIRPKTGKGSMDDPPCTMFSSLERADFASISEALEHIRSKYTEQVAERARKAGADYIETAVDSKERRYGLGAGFDKDQVLLEVEVKVTAVGKPKHFVRKTMKTTDYYE